MVIIVKNGALSDVTILDCRFRPTFGLLPIDLTNVIRLRYI